MRVRGWLIVSLFAVLAGCTAAPPAAEDDLGDGARTSEGGSRPNVFLLDAPKPPSVRVSGGAEPVILADRAGEFLWIGDTSGVRWSADNGTTWTASPQPFPGRCDGIALAQDDAGRLWAANTNCQTIQFAWSTSDGKGWNQPLLGQSVARSIDAAPIADRPWIAARGNGEASILYYDFGRTMGEACLRTTNAGLTWTDRGVGPLRAGAGNAVYDSLGRLHYAVGSTVWRYSGTCLGGASAFRLGDPVGLQVFEVIDVDEADRVYLAAPSSGNAQIRLYGTTDFVTRRSLVVSPPELLENTYATVAARGDTVAVAWYGTETSGDFSSPSFPGQWNVFVAVVEGFWTASPTVTHVRLTTEPNHVGQFCMAGINCGSGDDRDLLDYFGVDIDVYGQVHVAYGHDGTTADSEVRHGVIAPAA